MSTLNPGHGPSKLKSSEAANARFERKSEDDDSMLSPSATCSTEVGRAGSYKEEIPASKSPEEPNKISASRQDLDRPRKRSGTYSTHMRSRSGSNKRTRGDSDGLYQEVVQQLGKRGSSSHASPASLVSSGEMQQRTSGNAVLPGMSSFASESEMAYTLPKGIRERTEACQHLFAALQQQPGALDGDWIDKMSAEFNWWSLGIGATKRNHSSLDYRVQSRDDFRNVIMNLLDSLSISLRNCENLANPPPMEAQKSHEAEVVLEESPTVNTAKHNPSDGDGEFEEQVYYIEITLKYLARISTAIRKSGTKFRHQRIDKLLEQRVPKLEEFRAYLLHIVLLGSVNTHLLSLLLYRYTETGNLTWKKLWIVLKARFTDPERLTAVQARLIHANLVRRNRFDVYFSKYSQLVGEKQSKDDQMEEPKLAEPAQVILPTPISQPAKNVVAISDLQKENPQHIDRSVISSQSATEIGTIIIPERPRTHGSRSASTKLSQGVSREEYPKCPAAIGDSLWCPCCAQPLDTSYADPKRDKKWRGHLAEDLSPYVCIYPHCDTSDAMYVTTDDWKKHMKESHSVCRWICDACWFDSDEPTQFQYESEQAWLDHIKTQHEDAFEDDDLPDLAEESQRTALPPVQCPLCHGHTPLLNPETDKHIAEHLHSFSLQALPWEIIGPDQDTQASVGSTAHQVLSLDDGEEAASEVEQNDVGNVGHLSLTEINSIATLCFDLMAQTLPERARSEEAQLGKLNDTLDGLSWILQRISEMRDTYSSGVKGELQTHLVHLKSVLQRRDAGDISDRGVEQLAILEQDLEASVTFLREFGGVGEQPSKPAFLVPYARNNTFIGRTSTLQELQQRLKHRPNAKALLVGFGGIGKTQIALEYSYILKETCTNMSVFWVDGSSADRFRQSYTSIAQNCCIPGYDTEVRMLPLVKKWLERRAWSPWLMILDGADDAELFFPSHKELKNTKSSVQQEYLRQYVPECAHGSILITSRTRQASRMLGKEIGLIEVERMDDVEAIKLLRVRLTERHNGPDKDELLALAREADFIPLALVQGAASWIPNLLGPNGESAIDAIQFGLVVRQQPRAARACGFGDRGRRVIDPPPIVQLKINGPGLSEEEKRAYLRYPHYILNCSILDSTGTSDASYMPDEYQHQRRLTGSLVATPFIGEDDRGAEGCFFCFSDLSCRTPGPFRLKFSLVMINPAQAAVIRHFPMLTDIKTEVFHVYTAKEFPGTAPSSELAKRLKEQGCIISIKKGNKRAKARGLDGRSDDEDE